MGGQEVVGNPLCLGDSPDGLGVTTLGHRPLPAEDVTVRGTHVSGPDGCARDDTPEVVHYLRGTRTRLGRGLELYSFYYDRGEWIVLTHFSNTL